MKCIFCLSTDSTKFNTIEHIVPESLGGGDWAILPEGLFCDSCQNKFGSTIEQQALADYPLANFRTLTAIPTKKRKAPWFKYMEGNLISGGAPGLMMYEPNEYFREPMASGHKTMTIGLAYPKKPDMILRTFLKIGLELIAADDKTGHIFNEIYDPARNYALNGTKKYPWFYIQLENFSKYNLYLQGKLDRDDLDNAFEISIAKYVGVEFLYFQLMYLKFMVPLYENVSIDPRSAFKEPEERLFMVN